MQIENLSRTIRSIENQTDSDWSCFVVANQNAEMPALSSRISVLRVDFPPNPAHDIDKVEFESAMEFFRFDKGQRVEVGLAAAKNSDYVMIVDDDDFVSRNLVSYVKKNSGCNGWFIGSGYGIDYGGSFVLKLDRFHKKSGTSHIVRTSLYPPVPSEPEARASHLRKWLGSHGATTERFEQIGAGLSPLPFPGAVYLCNHQNSHSSSNTIWRNYIFNKSLLLNPLAVFARLSKLRIVSREICEEFFGAEIESAQEIWRV